MIDRLAWVRIEYQAILVARSRGDSTYYLPGEKSEHGERDPKALSREIEQELSVMLWPATVRFVGEFVSPAQPKPTDALVRVRCYSGDYLGVLTPASEIEEMDWFRYADRKKVSALAQLIFDFFHAEGLLQ